MKILASIILILFTVPVNAQDPFLQENDESIEKMAKELSETYNKQLALNGKQPLLFQKKIEEFLIRERDIRRQFRGKEMLDLINKLRETETGEMGNILTRPQLNVYKRIKHSIQPLDIVK